MPHKNKVARKEYKKTWRTKNKTKQKKYNETWKNKIKAWYIELKTSGFCVVCGDSRSAVLELHHRIPKEKTFSIYEGVKRGVSLRRLKLEVEKCSFLCNKCHRLLHTGTFSEWEEKQWKRHLKEVEENSYHKT